MSAYPSFPELSRAPALKTKTATNDPTLRDTMENGMVSTRARFTRRRRQWTVALDFLTNDDMRALDLWVQNVVVYGANIFFFPDNRDPTSPQQLMVRFSKLPEYTDAGWAQDQFRQHCTFTLDEV